MIFGELSKCLFSNTYVHSNIGLFSIASHFIIAFLNFEIAKVVAIDLFLVLFLYIGPWLLFCIASS